MQYAGETDIVANLYVKNVTMRYAENGARIKVFGGSPDASAYRYVSTYCSSTHGGVLQTAPLEEVRDT